MEEANQEEIELQSTGNQAHPRSQQSFPRNCENGCHRLAPAPSPTSSRPLLSSSASASSHSSSSSPPTSSSVVPPQELEEEQQDPHPEQPILSPQPSPPHRAAPSPLPAPARRPDIDAIRVCLTWGILLHHAVLIYVPRKSFLEDPFTEYEGRQPALVFYYFMESWNMPMFFFLSGINAFSSMTKRTSQAFCLERYHRLLVPALVIMAFTQFPFSLTFFARLSKACQEHRDGRNSNETCYMWDIPGVNQSFIDYVGKNWGRPPETPNARQGWFLVYLFFFSQLLAYPFYLWHPSSAGDVESCCYFDTSHRRCCAGLHRLCCTGWLRRFSRPFGRATPTPLTFAGVAFWFLGSGVKLALVPGSFLAVVEISLRKFFPNGLFNFFSFAVDIANDFNFCFVYLVGFAIALLDDRIAPILRRCAWPYLAVGTVVCLTYGCFAPFRHVLVPGIVGETLVRGLLRGFGEWSIVLGLVGMTRKHITTYPPFLDTLTKASMPFYLIHLQVLVLIGVFTLQVPVLRYFPFLLLFSTLVSGLLALFLSRSGSLGYFFGVRPPRNAWLPGKGWLEFGPGFFLAGVLIVETSVATAFNWNYSKENYNEPPKLL